MMNKQLMMSTIEMKPIKKSSVIITFAAMCILAALVSSVSAVFVNEAPPTPQWNEQAQG